MKKILTYLAFPLLIILILVLYNFSVHRNEMKLIKKVEVTFREGDNYFLTHNMVHNLLVQNGYSVVNQPKCSLNLFNLEQELLKNPFVEQANVYIEDNDLLKVSIKQREPIARIVTEKGNFYLDKYLKKIPVSPNFSARVPLVSLKYAKDIKKLKKLLDIIKRDEFLEQEVIAIERVKDDFLLDVRSGNYKINIGDLTDIDAKFNKLKAFYKKKLIDKTIQKYKEINLKYRNQVVCTKI